MPLEKIINNNMGDRVAIWHLTENLDELLDLIELSSEDKQTISQFKLDKRKQEWICSRLLLKQLLNEYPQIGYSTNGKPYLKNSDLHISISHTNGYVAVCAAHSPTALDIEIGSPRVEKAASRFVHDDEWKFIQDDEKISFLTLIWSAKETLYKYFDEWGVVFKEHFRILPFELKEKGEFYSHCRYKHYDQQLVLNYEVTPDYTIVYHLKM